MWRSLGHRDRTNPHAVTAAAANAGRNGVAGIVAVETTPVAELTGVFDVIVANIGAPTLIGLAPAIRSCLAGGGWLGLSGISPAQLSVLAAAYGPLQIVETMCDDDWAALVATASPI